MSLKPYTVAVSGVRAADQMVAKRIIERALDSIGVDFTAIRVSPEQKAASRVSALSK